MVKQLDSLPESINDYWEGADVQTHVLKPLVDCKHEFTRKGMEIECTNCHMGLFLSPGDIVKNGHLYKGRKKII